MKFFPLKCAYCKKTVYRSKGRIFVIFYLDSRNQEIKREIISVGSLNANLVH